MRELNLTFLKEVHQPLGVGRRVKTLIGRKFTRITPLGFLGIYKHQARWLCLCKCGTIWVVTAAKLLQNLTKSCGCYSHDACIAASTTHGQAQTRLYRLWGDMKTRGSNPNYKQAKDYIERGITVCQGFRKFENFLELLGQPPSEKHEIDRIENDQGYWCGDCDECASLGRILNVHWADDYEQAQNKRNNRLITAGNETLALAEWARRCNLNPQTIVDRLGRGESPEEAVDLIFKERTHQSRAFRSRKVL